ncbi:poly-gamma-glutamate synthase PgsB [Peptoniphilus porci]|uniref:Poly-gamma-glutamate synthase PgsB n=1 Tax=Peptoniphilus porci TaxID=2652280 RepID=A0A1U7M0K9_9FIRM|nr:poly-gamma-glutamate synthase PgsB [Peptoniphilus porci]OLR65210.1 poly-gamma-glutamate synthase PgsB [Peptoniphilus porci]
MEIIILILWCNIIIYLIFENYYINKISKSFKYIIYVNGTRGKSSTTRLIDSGLRSSNYKIFSKTTGTIPMYIDVNNNEIPIRRFGKANIKEQMKIMKLAYKQNADILVLECMAVDPELQFISQNKMVKSNIGVITNVRLDHTDVMGDSLTEICHSLCNTIPKNGVCFTSDEDFFDCIQKESLKLNTKTFLSVPDESTKSFTFPDNYAIALDVCSYIGVNLEDSLNGMKVYKHDPYDLSLYKLKNGGIFINGLSINDISSINITYNNLCTKYNLHQKNLILLINNRFDRGYRSMQMINFANKVKPKAVYLMGSHTYILKSKINCNFIKIINKIQDLPLEIDEDNFIYAIGNIGNNGNEIIDFIRKRGDLIAR